MCRLANNFPAHPIATVHSPLHIGPSTEQLLEESESARNAEARETAALRAKVDRLQTEVEYITKDRYTLVEKNLILENRLGDFSSWPEFRIEYDQLTTEFVAMKRAREREHTLQEQTHQIAEEARIELAAAKRAQAKSDIEHRKELKRLQQERDEAKEKYGILLATNSASAANTTATTAPAVPAAAAAVSTTTVPRRNIPGDSNLQEESNRLTLLLATRSILSNLASDLDKLQSQLRNQSRHSAFQLEMAKLTITSLEREKAKAEEHVARLERDLQKAKAEAAEWEERYMLVAFGDGSGSESGRDEKGSGDEKEDEDGEEEEG